MNKILQTSKGSERSNEIHQAQQAFFDGLRKRAVAVVITSEHNKVFDIPFEIWFYKIFCSLNTRDIRNLSSVCTNMAIVCHKTICPIDIDYAQLGNNNEKIVAKIKTGAAKSQRIEIILSTVQQIPLLIKFFDSKPELWKCVTARSFDLPEVDDSTTPEDLGLIVKLLQRPEEFQRWFNRREELRRIKMNGV